MRCTDGSTPRRRQSRRAAREQWSRVARSMHGRASAGMRGTTPSQGAPPGGLAAATRLPASAHGRRRTLDSSRSPLHSQRRRLDLPATARRPAGRSALSLSPACASPSQPVLAPASLCWPHPWVACGRRGRSGQLRHTAAPAEGSSCPLQSCKFRPSSRSAEACSQLRRNAASGLALATTTAWFSGPCPCPPLFPCRPHPYPCHPRPYHPCRPRPCPCPCPCRHPRRRRRLVGRRCRHGLRWRR